MDFNLKQWRNQQHESEQQEEEQPAVKMPKLLLDSNYYESALPLFVPEQQQQPTCKISNLSAVSDSTPLPESLSSNSTRSFPKMGGGGSYFSWAQRQELELQALIFKYMTHGVVVPQELLLPIKKSLLQSSPYFLHHPIQHYSYYQPALLQAGYWGRAAMDPEPGRCRRTDGKKWRCSRDVVAGQKYCERHVHRGRNRSRKPVEIPTPSSSTAAVISSVGGAAVLGSGSAYNTASTILAPPLATLNNNTFRFTGQSSSSTQFLHHNNGSASDSKANSNDGRILRHFFDDWPKSESLDSQMNSATCLSISMPGIPTSDVSLKLAVAGGGGEMEGERGGGDERELMQPQLNWNGGGWGAGQVGSMGGPLAEALRSSSATTNSSPTSVLHHLARASAS